MAANRLLRFLPLLFFAGLAILSFLLNFNGLYGQDAHEYLRQSQSIFARLRGGAAPAQGLGDLTFAGGYPLLAALLRCVVADAGVALQVAAWAAAAVAFGIFERLLALLTPGARAETRWVFAGLAWALAPAFFRVSMTCMSDGLGLAFALAAFFFGLRAVEKKRGRDALGAAVFAALAISTRYALAALLLPLAVAVGFFLLKKKKWGWAVGALSAGAVALLPHFWLKSGGAENPLGHSMFAQWNFLNVFKSTFYNQNGLADYTLPNGIFVFSPLAHPSFCLLLPGLFLLFKKTDLALPAKKILLASLLAYLVLLVGLPHQNARHLLPAYALLLLLLFPAWDRFFSYGFYFFKRLTWGVLGLLLACQVFFSARALAPMLARQRLETSIAREIRPIVPPGALLFGFDLDVAMRSYLPDVQHRSLWERRYADFPPGSFVLFNETALRDQWAGQNPMLNWIFLRDSFELKERRALPGGWSLYEVARR
jgi:hypothetical protein